MILDDMASPEEQCIYGYTKGNVFFWSILRDLVQGGLDFACNCLSLIYLMDGATCVILVH
jgi:hypothetical protein